MPDDGKKTALQDLGNRLRQARSAHRARHPENTDPPPSNAMGIAMRLGIELVTGVAVGTAIGWFLDNWLGTMPLFLLVFFFLGAGAGTLNVFRSAREMGLAGDADNDDEQANEQARDQKEDQ